MVIVQIDALDQVLQHSALARGNPLTQCSCCRTSPLQQRLNFRAIVDTDRTVDGGAVA